MAVAQVSRSTASHPPLQALTIAGKPGVVIANLKQLLVQQVPAPRKPFLRLHALDCLHAVERQVKIDQGFVGRHEAAVFRIAGMHLSQELLGDGAVSRHEEEIVD